MFFVEVELLFQIQTKTEWITDQKAKREIYENYLADIEDLDLSELQTELARANELLRVGNIDNNRAVEALIGCLNEKLNRQRLRKTEEENSRSVVSQRKAKIGEQKLYFSALSVELEGLKERMHFCEGQKDVAKFLRENKVAHDLYKLHHTDAPVSFNLENGK